MLTARVHPGETNSSWIMKGFSIKIVFIIPVILYEIFYRINHDLTVCRLFTEGPQSDITYYEIIPNEHIRLSNSKENK